MLEKLHRFQFFITLKAASQLNGIHTIFALCPRQPNRFRNGAVDLPDASDTWREDGIPFWTLVGTATDGIAWLRDLE